MTGRTQQTLTLADGRRLGYAEYGDPAGTPVIFLQGTPSSRLMHPDETITAQRTVRLIAIDRPGFGLSDFQPGRTLLDWPRDLTEFADKLGIDRFPVVGISGGGPYVLACACAIPERLTKVLSVAGSGPFYAPGASREMTPMRKAGAALARYAPGLLRPLVWLTNHPGRNPEAFYEKFRQGLSGRDAAIQARPEMRQMFVSSYAEAARQGVRGLAWEIRLFGQPWGFDLQDIHIPVHLWHGTADHSTPVEMARHIADAIPNCELTLLEGEGHLFLFDRWAEILDILLDQ